MRRLTVIATALILAIALVPAIAIAEGECGTEYTPIYAIQGDGSSSPLEGADVTTEGVVTVDSQRNDQHRGVFLQDPEGDGDAATSDGIFVFLPEWEVDVTVGQRIRVSATVVEWFGETQLGSVTSVVDCGRDRVRPLAISAPGFNENPEQYEGMWLRFGGGFFVTDTFNLHRFGEIWLAEGGVVELPTNEELPDSPEMHQMAAAGVARSILVDDGSRFSNPQPIPFLNPEGTLRLGDKTANPSGAIQFAFGAYKLIPDGDLSFQTRNPRPVAPTVAGEVTVATFNVLNYWTTLGGRGAATQESLDVQTDKLVAAINQLDADIVGLQEIENDPSHTPILTLVEALNADLGMDVWSWVGPASYYNIYPIRNEIIYRNDRVEPVGPPIALEHPAFDEFRSGDPTPDNQLGRPPLAQAFEADGKTFTVINAHLKSKSGTGAEGDDVDQGDGQSAYNARRVYQAETLLEFVAHMAETTGDPDVLVIGDMNSYLQEDPVKVLESELLNVLWKFDKDPYSFNFFASFAFPFAGRGTLDHILATPSMRGQILDAEIWHINADEPRFLDWFDPSITAPGPYRSSDHDPIVVGLSLR